MNTKQRVQFKNQLLLTVLKTAGLIMLGVLGIFYFSRDIKKSVVESVQKRVQISAQTRQVENFTRLKSDYEKLESYFPALKTALPGGEELIIVPLRLEREARIIGIAQIFAFGREEAASGAEPQGILFSLDFDATGNQFLEYLERINAQPYSIAFTQFEMISARGHKSNSNFSVKGKIYSR